MRTLGFDVTNDIFAKNAWYFRNTLVRANYNDLKNDIHETTEYLELFLRNLLLNERNKLSNHSMHISGLFNQYSKVDIETKKVDIETQKVDIHTSIDINISNKTRNHIIRLYSKFNKEIFFGRSQIEEEIGLKASGASKLIKIMLDYNVIEPVRGYGKGKYRFK